MRSVLILLVSAIVCSAQTPRDVRAAAKQGNVATVAGYLNSASVDTRVEAVKQLISLGGKDTVDPLIKATKDADPEVQIRATDGLVNFYLPGYVKQGLGSSLVRAGATVKAKFSDSNDQTIDTYVTVRPDVVDALGLLVRGGSSIESRANACRALGILRGRAALPQLIDALRSKENAIMYEALAAIEKIRDPSAGPKITFLLRDLDDKVQMTAIEAAGVLRDTDGLPTLRSIVASPRNTKAERSAMAAIAMMPEMQDRDLFLRYLNSKDEKLRASAAEGLGRIDNPADLAVIDKAWHEDDKMAPRLAAAFAVVMEGKLDLGEDGAFRYLINNLNQAAWHETAYAYLAEAALRKPVLEALYTQLDSGTRDEKIYLSRVLSVSGNGTAVPYLEKMSRDNDAEVAKEGLRALRSLRARLGI